MTSPASCVRCSSPLPAGSAERLCPACLTAGDTAALDPVATPRSEAPAAAATATHFPPPLRTPVDTHTVPAARVGWPPAPPGYELLAELGHGGMGDVYLARDQATERTVAMKFLRARGNSGVAVERFLTEVRALARLDHPNIVRIFATDFHRADPFFTMEHAPGGTLADRVMAHGPLAPREAAGLMAAAARAVHAAHAAKVLHRDLKPSNILLAGAGGPEAGGREDASGPPVLPSPAPRLLTPAMVKVSDFGLAKLTDRDDGLTDPSMHLGTPWFMPPEQVSRRYGAVGPAADVYGLGATLYYLLTGRPPVTGSREEALGRVVTELPERVRRTRPDVPPGLDAVVMRCLEKNPAARPPTPAALAAALERGLAPDPPSPPRLWRARRWARHHRGRLAAVGALVALAVVVVVAAVAPWRPPPPLTADEVRRELRAGRRVTLVGADGKVRVQTDWAIGPGAFTPSRIDGTRCSFQTRETVVLVLIDDPGVPRFLVRADLRQDQALVADGPPGQAATDLGQAGLTVGLHETPTVPPAGVYTFWAVQFQEYHETDAGPRPDRKVQVMDRALDVRPVRAVFGSRQGGSHIALAFPADPRPWRPVELEVRPAAVVVRHGGREVSDPAEKLNARRVRVEDRARAAGWPGAAGVVLPRWPPDPAGVGILANSCWVSARNVTIEPLP